MVTVMEMVIKMVVNNDYAESGAWPVVALGGTRVVYVGRHG